MYFALELLEQRRLLSATPPLTTSFATPTFGDPVDPKIAAGPNHVVVVNNGWVNIHAKTGELLVQQTITDFFYADEAPTPGDFTFDPRVIYDQQSGRFVAIAATKKQDSIGISGSYYTIKVSDDSDPTNGSGGVGHWNSLKIDTSRDLGTTTWVDFPNIAVGSDALYVVGTLFDRARPGEAYGQAAHTQLWIIRKDALYDNDAATAPVVNSFDPRVAAGLGSVVFGTQHIVPAQMQGAIPAGLGTFLVTYDFGDFNNGSSDQDRIYVIKVSNPTSTPTFTSFAVSLGNGAVTTLATSDALTGETTVPDISPDPVWRNGALWAVGMACPMIDQQTLVDAPERGQMSVHWMNVNTDTMALTAQGFIGGEELKPNTRTQFGSIAVNAAGDAVVGFSAWGPDTFSPSDLFPGAYYALKRAGESAFESPATLMAGTSKYTNRWGNYSGTAVDPADDTRFWIYNMYATGGGYLSRGGSFYSTPRVADRRVFYNDSKWDGNNTAANAADDGAIAPGKQALLPGQAASFANYTSYSKGINGIIIDVKGIPLNAALAAGDFRFQVGNGIDPAPANWPDGPAPSDITIRRGAGTGGSDRVTIVWPDATSTAVNKAVARNWLRVTVKSTPYTGLVSPDVFYFGNLISEVGDTNTNGWVSAVDLGQTKAAEQPGVLTQILSPYDHNRDGYVDTADEDLVRQNQLTRLYLLAANET